MDDQERDALLEKIGGDLDAIKRLLILAQLQSGTSQQGIAEALGVGQATVSRLFSKGLRSALPKKR